jgi:hypothetical protein
MQVDEVFVRDEFVNDDYFDETRGSSNKRSLRNVDDEYLTTEKFNYSMNLLDEKINSLYRLCRHISDKQQTDSQILQKLAVADELTDDFWNVSYFNILDNLLYT